MANRSPKDPRIPPLGDLEVAVLEYVWAAGEASAKQAHAAVGASRGIAPNTVQSALERLYRKQLLGRTKAGHAYRYAARVEREQLVAALINQVLGRFGGDSAFSAAAILDAAEQFDAESLRLIEAEIKRRKRREQSS